MKNLKKILMAFALVALLVSSIVTVAIADASYTGTVADANALILKAEQATGTNIHEEKTAPLAAVYTYLSENPIDPEEEGYDDVVKAYNEMTFKVAYIYALEVQSATTDAKKAEALSEVYVYLAKAPAFKPSDSYDFSIYLGYKCQDESCGKYCDFSASELFDDLSGLGCLECGAEGVTYANEYKYSDFEKDVNNESVSVAALILNNLFSVAADDKTGYFDVIAAKQAAADFAESILEISYTAPDSDLYTGDVAVVVEKLSALGDESNFVHYKDVLADVYGYLISTPVNPTTDEYFDFIADYNICCNVLLEKAADYLANAGSPSEKIQRFVDFRAYLVETPISSIVIEGFNEVRLELIDEFDGADSVLSGIPELSIVVPSIEYDDGYEDFAALVELMYSLPYGDTNLPFLIEELNTRYAAFAYDPTVEGRAEVLAKYDSVIANYVTSRFVDEMDSLDFISEKYTVLIEFRKYIAENTVPESAIRVYNDTRAALLDEARTLSAKINADKLPVYVAPAKPEATVTLSILYSRLTKLENSYNTYSGAVTDEEKSAALAEAMNAAKSLYVYIAGSVFDTEDTNYQDFVNDYSRLRDQLVTALLATVDNADTLENKLAALGSLRDYFSKTPLSRAAVEMYNARVDELIDDAGYAAAMKLDSVYFAIDSVYSLAMDEANALSERMAAMVELRGYTNRSLDVTDPAYTQALVCYEVAAAAVADEMQKAIVVALNELSVEDALVVIEEYLDYVNTVYTSSTVQAFRKAVKSTADTCDNIIKKIEANDATVEYYAPKAEAVVLLIEEFYAAEDIDEKGVAFAKLYDIFCNENNTEYFNIVFMSGCSYFGLRAEYEEILVAFENELMGTISIDQSPSVIYDNAMKVYDYITALPFSQRVADGYNASVKAAQQTNFAQYIDDLKTTYVPLEYVTPAGYSDDIADVIGYLDEAIAGANIAEEKFYEAYKILSGIAGAESLKLIDFGRESFYPLLVEFNNVKDTLISERKNAIKIDGGDDIGEEVEVLIELGDFVQQYPFSPELVEFYNDARELLIAEFDKSVVKSFELYTKELEPLYDHLEACPIDESVLDSAGRAEYFAVKALAEACKHFEVQAYIYEFDTLVGETALIYKNMVADELNLYTKNNSIGSYTDCDLANANIRFAFEKLLVEFDSVLDSLEASAITAKIEEVGAYFVNAGFGEELIDIYNATYGTSFVSNSVTAGNGEGSFAKLREYLIAFDKAAEFDEMSAALSAIVSYVNENPFSTEDRKVIIEQEIEELRNTIKKLNEEQQKLADSNADLDEYNIARQSYYTHEDGKLCATSLSSNGDKKGTILIKEQNGNKYAEFAARSNSNRPYLQINNLDYSKGIILDIDLMSYEGLDVHIFFQDSSIMTTAVQFSEGQLQYTFKELSNSRDDEGFPLYQQGVDAPITVAPGEWVHITIVVDVEAEEMELLVDYVSLGRKPIIAANYSTKVDDHPGKFGILRFQHNNKGFYTTCFDNFQIYGGTSYRIVDKFEKMNDAERFNTYVDYAVSDKYSDVNRLYAYYAAENLLSAAGAGCEEHKAKLESLDISKIKQSAHKVHIENLQTMIADIDAASMNTSNLSAMAEYIDAAESYIEANRQSIDKSSEEFVAINSVLIAAVEKRVWLENLSDYIAVLSRFHRAGSLAALTKHLEDVRAAYALCGLDDEQVAALAAADPKVVDFVAKMAKDASVINLVTSVTFISYYTEYIPARMYSQLCYENSKKILDCMEFINGFVENKNELSYDEYRAELLRIAAEEKEKVEPYVTAIRKIVNEGAYDITLDGFDDAINGYNVLNDIFLEALQTKHFAVIKSNLDRYTATDSYIEKAGICTFIENYINNNEVDMTSTLGVQYMYTLELYKAALEGYIRDYEAILEANTVAFIGTVQKMEAYDSYTELKPLYEEAISNYYYSMNADSEEARAAMQKFAVFEGMIKEWEESSAMFIGYSETLASARRQSHKFRALVNCTNYLDGIDVGVEGVSEALETYVAALEEYIEYIEPINNEISECTDVMLALGTNSVPSTVLAVIKNIISK